MVGLTFRDQLFHYLNAQTTQLCPSTLLIQHVWSVDVHVTNDGPTSAIFFRCAKNTTSPSCAPPGNPGSIPSPKPAVKGDSAIQE